MADPIQAAVHGPYEDAIIAGFTLVSKLIDGQTPEQKATIWQGWIDFWKPFNGIINKLGTDISKLFG
jgi:hypothetical protein